MDTQAIKDLIQSKITGQGNQVDAGGALGQILDAIVDAVGAITPIVLTITTSVDDFNANVNNIADFLEVLGFDSADEFSAAVQERPLIIKLASEYIFRADSIATSENFVGIIAGAIGQDYGARLEYTASSDSSELKLAEF